MHVCRHHAGLITGAFAERMKFHAFVTFILIWALFIYNPMAHWVWGGGFLAKLGALDFAGGLVIHILSGCSGPDLCVLLGRRYGYGKSPMVPHNLPMTVLGAALLWFGWFGFNAGSALAPMNWLPVPLSPLRPPLPAAHRLLGRRRMEGSRQTDYPRSRFRLYCSLVAITPAAGFVTTPSGPSHRRHRRCHLLRRRRRRQDQDRL